MKKKSSKAMVFNLKMYVFYFKLLCINVPYEVGEGKILNIEKKKNLYTITNYIELFFFFT